MTFYQLSFHYLIRKKGKTLLLLLVLLFVNSMILSTTILLRAAGEAKMDLLKKTDASIILEIKHSTNPITDSDIQSINALSDAGSLNRIAKSTVFPLNFHAVTGADDTALDSEPITLSSYDMLENDSPFSEIRYRLTSGNYIHSTSTGAVINTALADTNGLSLGDEITLQTAGGETTAVKIIGMFISGSESKQNDTISAVNRIENQIFIDNHTFTKLFPGSGYYKVSVYTDSPEKLNTLRSELQQIVNDKAELTTSDALYQQTVVPLNQMMRVTKLMLIITCLTGIMVVFFLLCLWMRTRQKETAVFISLGISKWSILLQFYLESLVIFLLSLAGACTLGSFLAPLWQTAVTSFSGITFQVLLHWGDIVFLFILGGLVLFTAVTGSVLPVMKAKPKDILSNMEV